MEDKINHPSHYTDGQYECIDVMIDVFGKETVSNFCLCNVFKYVFRHRKKNGREDLQKATWYLNKLLKLTEESKANKIIDVEDKIINCDEKVLRD